MAVTDDSPAFVAAPWTSAAAEGLSATTNAIAAGGASVWDARMGYNGVLVQTVAQRQVSVRDPYGAPQGTTVVRVNLPVGTLITAIETISPAGAVTSTATGYKWTVATSDATPVTVGSVTVPGVASAGWRVESVLPIPFLCNTSARAKLRITPTNVDQSSASGLVLIKGYW